MKVVLCGQTIDLTSNKMLGSGGEGSIIKHGKYAIKVYHKPTADRSKKLDDFFKRKFNLPANVLSPIEPVTNVKGKLVGFAMAVANKCTDFINLYDTTFRSTQQITSADVMKLFVHTKETLEAVHQAGLIIGDFNDLNQLFDKGFSSVFIDVDSWQFDNHPCIVGTDSYIDPNLYGIDLTKAPIFTKQTDWYSFAVLLFRSLLFVHPYGGMLKANKTLFGRAQNKIWVFDQNVIRPKISLHPETLSDELLSYFASMFSKGQRHDLPMNLLRQQTFVECKKCGSQFSTTRPRCPQCQKVAPFKAVDLSGILTHKIIGKEKCDATTMFETTGAILFVKVVAGIIVIVYYDGKNTITETINANGFKTSIVLWEGHQKDIKFDYFFPGCLVIGKNNELTLIDVVSDSQAKVITKTTTMSYADEPVFACSESHLYRLTPTMIMAAQLHRSGQLIEKSIVSAVENQTQLYMGQNRFGLGFYRIFSDYKYFTLSDKQGRRELELEQLEGQLIDVDVRTSMNSLILFRKSLHKGRTYSHWHVISDTGQILESKSEESINSELLKNIHGKELAGSNIIHSTDAGIAIEKHGDISLKVSTAEIVNSSHRLMLYKHGLLAVSEKKIVYLVLK